MKVTHCVTGDLVAEAVRPLVDRLLAELGDPLDVADQLRADGDLKGDFRKAALRVLLKLLVAERKGISR